MGRYQVIGRYLAYGSIKGGMVGTVWYLLPTTACYLLCQQVARR